MAEWTLKQHTTVHGVKVAYDEFGKGPPAVLVHGFPGNSYIWRNIVPQLALFRRVFVYDLPGQGLSEGRDGMDVSDGFQARVLCELLRIWGLETPTLILHDAGCTYGMAAHYFEGGEFEKIALISAGLLNPCVSAATMHARKYIEAYRTMPLNLHELIARARIQSTTYKPLDDAALAAYLKPWQGQRGQALWYNRVAQIREEFYERLEAKLAPLDFPVRILWGKQDTWIPVSHAERIGKLISNAEVHVIDEGGHFLMEDAPEEVAALLVDFLQ